MFHYIVIYSLGNRQELFAYVIITLTQKHQTLAQKHPKLHADERNIIDQSTELHAFFNKVWYNYIYYYLNFNSEHISSLSPT